jgi:D-alanine-D-alanine ligase
MKNVAIVYGGRSVEHEISVITALEAAQAIDTTRYKVTLVYIDLHGRWWTGEKLRDRSFYAAFHGRTEGAKLEVEEVTLLPTPGIGGLVRGSKDGVLAAVARLFGGGPKKDVVIPVDVWMPLLHGTYGEDGCIQGLFELTELPYTGAPVRAAAVGMSKPTTKALAAQRGVPVLPWVVVEQHQWSTKDPGPVLDRLTTTLSREGGGAWPLFVKPANLGSSVGVAKVEDAPGLIAALVKVFQHDTQAIVEPCVVDLSEINVSVRRINGAPVASVVEMPVRRSKSGVLTYEDKYVGPGGKKKAPSAGMATMARVTDPPELPQEFKDAARAHACTVYDALGCMGVSRIDFILDGAAGQLYFNEINTLPGSVAHYLWSASTPSLLYTELLGAMIEEAEARRGAERRLSREFGFKALK